MKGCPNIRKRATRPQRLNCGQSRIYRKQKDKSLWIIDSSVFRRRSPADISIPRSRLFYYRLSNLKSTANKFRGLSAKRESIHNTFGHFSHMNADILSRLQSPPSSPEKPVHCDYRQQDERSRLISKYVFPAQYRLSSVFAVEEVKRRSAGFVPDYSNRDQEIKVSLQDSASRRYS